ncbi:Arm DNA-binding domain-containing protein [Bacillus sp. SL00103]
MASIQKYETKKGIRWMYVIENGIDPKTGKRQRIPKRGFLREKDAKQVTLKWSIFL